MKKNELNGGGTLIRAKNLKNGKPYTGVLGMHSKHRKYTNTFGFRRF